MTYNQLVNSISLMYTTLANIFILSIILFYIMVLKKRIKEQKVK